jgi:signal transduction histidine kinase
VINNQFILTLVLGNRDRVGLERYFVTIACFITAIFLFILCLAHIILNLSIIPVIIAGSSSIVVAGLYYLARFRNLLVIPKFSLTFFGLLMLDLAWYHKFLSHGPVLFFILIYGALIIWVWEGKSLAFLISVYFLNIILLFIIEKTTPDYMLNYPEGSLRRIDIYQSLFLLSAFMIFMLYLVKMEFIRQKDNALKADRLKSAFLANMSHEIRTPMNAIIGFSELLGENISPERRKQYNKIIKNSCKNLLRLINDILDLSIIEAGDMEIKYSDFSIRELFIELRDTYKLELNKRGKPGVKLDYVLPSGDLIIHSDALRVKQVLSNLLDNAVKFTFRGEILLTCVKEGKELVFKVSDTGAGIPEENQKSIFDRFTKFDYNGNNAEGSGIGLSIVDKIITLLKGRIWLESIFGKGSSFYFSLPCDSSVTCSLPADSPVPDSQSSTEAANVQPVPDSQSSTEAANVQPVPDSQSSPDAETVQPVPDSQSSPDAETVQLVPDSQSSPDAATLQPVPNSPAP